MSDRRNHGDELASLQAEIRALSWVRFAVPVLALLAAALGLQMARQAKDFATVAKFSAEQSRTVARLEWMVGLEVQERASQDQISAMEVKWLGDHVWKLMQPLP